MKKFSKKLAALAMVAAMTVTGFTGCGSNGDNNGGSSDATEFVIGGIGPTTGTAEMCIRDSHKTE